MEGIYYGENSIQLLAVLKGFCLTNTSVETVNSKTAEWAINTGLAAIVADFSDHRLVNNSLLELLTSSKLTSQFWTQTQLEAAKIIIKELNKKNIRPTLLKGISINTQLYSRPYYRAMSDIDILVNSSEIVSTELILSMLGYEQRSTYSKEFYQTHHHTMPWQHSKNEIWLEIHKGLFPDSAINSNGIAFKLKTIHDERIKDDFFGFDVYRLSYELQIVYIASHWAQSFKQVGGVFALIDTALIINQNYKLDWEKIIYWANESNIANYCYLVLQYLDSNGFIDETVNIKQYTAKIEHSLSGLDVYLLNKIITCYIIEGRSYGRIMTKTNVNIIWKKLLASSTFFPRVWIIPIAIIFPEESARKFNLKFQISRIMSLFRKK